MTLTETREQATEREQVSLAGLTLHVADVERSREFYARMPGAVLVAHRPGEFALFCIGRSRLGLLRHDGGFHMEFECGSLDGTYAQLRDAGFAPDGPPTERAWGRRDFRLTDPDGNTLEFDEADDAPACVQPND